MALFRDLVRTIAEAEGLSEMGVTGVGQYLRDEGLISKHGRGKSAATMTVSDAVNLLIGVNASALAKDAPAVVRQVRGINDREDIYPIPEDAADEDQLTRALYRPQSAGLMLDRLLGCFIPRDAVGYNFLLTFSRPRFSVELWAGWLADDASEDLDEPLTIIRFISGQKGSGDRSDRTTITEKTLSAVGHLLGQ